MDGVVAELRAPHFSSSHGLNSVWLCPNPPGGTPILMRTGKCLSAETIMSRGLPGTPVPRSFSSTMARSRMAVQNQKQTTSNILALKRGCLGRRQDGVPRIGRYRSVKPLIPNHVHRIYTVAH